MTALLLSPHQLSLHDESKLAKFTERNSLNYSIQDDPRDISKNKNRAVSTDFSVFCYRKISVKRVAGYGGNSGVSADPLSSLAVDYILALVMKVLSSC